MKRAIAGLATVLSLLAGSAFAGDTLAFDQFWLAPVVSTQGVGIEGGYRWNDYWGGRVSVNGLETRFTYHDNNADFNNRLSLLSTGVTADYYPFAGDFRLSGGVRLSDNRIDGRMSNLVRHSNGMTIIVPDPLTRYTVRQNAIQPYIGAGYSVRIKERVSLNFDFGALYAGKPELNVVSHADLIPGITRPQIDKEIERQRDRLAPLQIYPVVQVGLTVRF